ncbi:hypothetical protein H6P81_000016 [Aristolochia fimbriata]|nr:hypothetical protein H6P81_000016 [Aristolochia fimbriata]
MKIDGECLIELIGSCRNKVQISRSVRMPQLHTSLHFHLTPIVMINGSSRRDLILDSQDFCRPSFRRAENPSLSRLYYRGLWGSRNRRALILGWAYYLDAFSSYPLRTWLPSVYRGHDNWYTRATALPLGTVGSLRPTFVPARRVGLAVKLPSAFALEGQSPSGPRKPLHASVTLLGGLRPIETVYLRLSLGPVGPGHKVRILALPEWYLTDGSDPPQGGFFAFHLSCAGKAQSQSQGTTCLFHRVSLRDSAQIVTPFVRVGTYPTRNFCYLRTVIVTAAVHRGFGRRLPCHQVTNFLDLPALGRRQPPYVVLRLRGDLCFGKQSPGPGHCDPLCEEAPLLPKLRGYFAEFLRESCLAPLGILYPPTCVGFWVQVFGALILTNVCVTADILASASSTPARAGAFPLRRNAPLPMHFTSHSFGRSLSPVHLRRKSARSVSYYALFQGWLLLGKPPGCLCTPTSFITERSPRFGSISSDNCPMKTRFRYGSGGFPLTKPLPMSRRLILQQARGQRSTSPPTAWELTVSCSISLPDGGSFSPFPHGTTSLSVTQEYLALQGGPCGFTRDSTCPMLLGSERKLAVPISARRYYGNRFCFLFPLATKMFQFARLSLACPWIQQQFERLTYSGISGSMLIFNSPKHFVACYALPRLWVPRYPP